MRNSVREGRSSSAARRTKLARCGERREFQPKRAPTNGRDERIGGCRYVDLSYTAQVEYPKSYGSDSP